MHHCSSGRLSSETRSNSRIWRSIPANDSTNSTTYASAIATPYNPIAHKAWRPVKCAIPRVMTVSATLPASQPTCHCCRSKTFQRKNANVIASLPPRLPEHCRERDRTNQSEQRNGPHSNDKQPSRGAQKKIPERTRILARDPRCFADIDLRNRRTYERQRDANQALTDMEPTRGVRAEEPGE